jgi:hypothetical protein
MGRTSNLSNIRGGTGRSGTLAQGNMIYGRKLVGGSGNQGLYTQSATKYYTLGTRLVTPDGRVFRYAKCSASRTTGFAMMFNGGIFATVGADGGVLLPVAIVAGDNHCHVTITATDGSNQASYETADGAVTADELEGGYLYVYGTQGGGGSDTYQRENRYITGNTAVAAGGGVIQVNVEEPFTFAHSTSIKVEVMPNPWATLAMIAEDYVSVAGFPVCGTVTSGYYFWCQTWGPLRISGQNYNLGKTAGERNIWFGPDGSIRSSQIQGATNCRQLAGFVLPRTSASFGNTFLMLQICP